MFGKQDASLREHRQWLFFLTEDNQLVLSDNLGLALTVLVIRSDSGGEGGVSRGGSPRESDAGTCRERKHHK